MATAAHTGLHGEKHVRRLLRRYLDEQGWHCKWQAPRTDGKEIEAVLLDKEKTPIAAICVIFNIHPAEIANYIRRNLSQINISAEKIPYLLALYAPQYPHFEQLVSYIISELKNYNIVSAFGFLHEFDVEQFIWNNQDDRVSERHKELLKSVYRMREYRARIGRSDLPEMKVVRMQILLNPYASRPWADKLWGVYDEVWTWDAQQGKLQNLYEGRWELLRTYRIRLLAGVVSVPFREDVSNSRSENFYEERD